MKKSLIAFAAAACCGGAAFAQSSVTLFGIVDATLSHGSASGGTRSTQLTNSGLSSSRLGFRGVEDLGGGLSASFWLEAGIGNDDGRTGGSIPAGNQAVTATGLTGLNFNRRSTVSLTSTRWGEVRIGRDYTPAFWNRQQFDPFGNLGVGTTLTTVGASSGLGAGVPLTPFGAGSAGPLVRASNSFGYFTPKLGGFYGQAMYHLGENAKNGAVTEDDGNGWGLRAGYNAGPLNVAFAYEILKAATTAANGDFRSWNIGAWYMLGRTKLQFNYARDKTDTLVAREGRGGTVGFNMPVGAVGELRGSWTMYKIDAGALHPKATKLAIGYIHNLSKRTALYATVGRVRNSGGAALGLNGSTFAAGVVDRPATGYDIGLRHSF